MLVALALVVEEVQADPVESVAEEVAGWGHFAKASSLMVVALDDLGEASESVAVAMILPSQPC